MRHAVFVAALSLILVPSAFAASDNDLMLSITMSEGNPPSFNGKTNLVDGTLISFTVRGDLPGCIKRCGYEGDAKTEGGRFHVEIISDRHLEDDSYTIDVVTTDQSRHLKFPTLDPTDNNHMIRWTARLKVNAAGSQIVSGTARLLPFLYDAKYFRDEFDHGHQTPQ
ncbi:hypothetical protein [Rhizobium leucaenae]|uniref:Uncharacterized protein n=1 Tax=Rhizobium leucaenae TaxID=29450 RepID=A0A7W6ZRA9_9HYPH|nr:hypothetical protein [Rhizobium leucaenae]MBB4566757.1 hypothetical protein [Rhizobium leucaenae]MBB6301348.1 hypothetical protein [Rhizobium leucaenae]